MIPSLLMDLPSLTSSLFSEMSRAGATVTRVQLVHTVSLNASKLRIVRLKALVCRRFYLKTMYFYLSRNGAVPELIL